MPDDYNQSEDESLLEAIGEGAEGEDDLDAATLIEQIGSVTVGSSDWTTETILRQLERGNINLNPRFQRRDAWKPGRKSKFIESIILGLPIPQLVLAESKTQRGSFIVIDGKQRLLSLRQFASGEEDADYPQLKLEGLEVKKNLIGKSLRDLRDDTSFTDELRAFENQTIRTVVIRGWKDDQILHLIFSRLNTGSVQLSTQELRHALKPGKFVDFIDERSSNVAGLQKILNLKKPDFRMRDAELLVRYYAFKNFLPGYKGNLKSFLDKTCEDLNKEWSTRGDDIRKQADDLGEALNATFEIFGDKEAFTKWDGSQYEGRFNRAVFDIMVYFFSRKEIRSGAVRVKKKVESAFKKLCQSNPQFLKSIETTTKSLVATATRLNLWGHALKRLKIPVRAIPTLKGKKILL